MGAAALVHVVEVTAVDVVRGALEHAGVVVEYLHVDEAGGEPGQRRVALGVTRGVQHWQKQGIVHGKSGN